MPPQIAVAGISGKVGNALCRYCPAGTQITALIHKTPCATPGIARAITDFEITDKSIVTQVVRALARANVKTIVNCAGQVDLDGVERERYAADPAALSAYRTNALGAHLLAEACAEISREGTDVLLLHISSESVFGDNVYGKKYTEDDRINIPKDPSGAVRYTDSVTMPTWYGFTKALGELKVLEEYPAGSVVVRMHGVQGPQGGFFARTIAEIQKGEPFTRVKDMYVAHLSDATIAGALFAIEQAMHDPQRKTRGIYHLSARTALTPFDISLRFADLCKKPRSIITPILLEELIESGRRSDRPLAPRPHYTILSVSKFEEEFYRLPAAEETIDDYMNLYGRLFDVPRNR